MLRKAGIGVCVAALAGVTSVDAQNRPTPHVRPDKWTAEIVRDARRLSPMVRDLVARLDRSDLTVYIRVRPPTPPTFRGQLNFLSRTPCQRFVVVELPSNWHRLEQIGMLGHELRHAVEIAETPHVVDAATMIELYERIGTMSGATVAGVSFETDAAIESGREVYRQAAETAKRGLDTDVADER